MGLVVLLVLVIIGGRRIIFRMGPPRRVLGAALSLVNTPLLSLRRRLRLLGGAIFSLGQPL